MQVITPAPFRACWLAQLVRAVAAATGYRFESDTNSKIKKVMKNENWWNGFILGFTIGGIVGIIILDLVQKGVI